MGAQVVASDGEAPTRSTGTSVQFLPGDADALGYGSHALMWPYFGLGMPLNGGRHHESMVVDRVPVGEVEVHRGDQRQRSGSGSGSGTDYEFGSRSSKRGRPSSRMSSQGAA